MFGVCCSGSGGQASVERFPLLSAAYQAAEPLTASEAECVGVHTSLLGGKDAAPVSAVVDALHSTYAAGVGAEFGYVDDEAERAWLASHFEEAFHPGAAPISAAAARNAYMNMAKAEAFELFLQKKLPTYKRCEGRGDVVGKCREGRVEDPSSSVWPVIVLCQYDSVTVLCGCCTACCRCLRVNGVVLCRVHV